MFRVPKDLVWPTFDDVAKISFWRWLTSSKSERIQWKSLRNRAAMNAKINQDAKARDWVNRQRERRQRR